MFCEPSSAVICHALMLLQLHMFNNTAAANSFFIQRGQRVVDATLARSYPRENKDFKQEKCGWTRQNHGLMEIEHEKLWFCGVSPAKLMVLWIEQ